MAGNNIKGITVEINGETGPLDKALKGVNKTSSDLQAQLKQVNYQLKFDPKNTILLQQKQELLAKSVTGTKEKLETLKSAEAQAQAQFAKGDISEKQYQALQREVIKTESQLKNLEIQAQKSNSTLSKVSEASDKIAKGATKVGQATTPATLAVVALGGAAVKMGSDYIESLNKVDVAFGGSAKGVENFSKTTLDNFGIAAGTALDMAAGYGDMATSMGLPQAAAATMSEKLVGLGGDLASFKNIGISEANTALTSIFTGETESLKKLGIVMTQANLQEFAASKGIKTKIANMSQSEQVQLRYNYVMEKTKNAQGDFARTSDGAANSMRVASESAKEASASIGIILAPLVAKAAQYISDLAKGFNGLSEGTKKTILVILAVVAVIAPLAFIISGIATVVGAVTAVIATVGGAIAVLTTGVAAATPAIGALVAIFTFITGPVGIAIAIIAALVIGFKLLWDNCAPFKAFWIDLWNNIMTITKTVVDALIGFFTVTIPAAWNSLVIFFTGIPAWFSGLWTSVKTSTTNAWTSIKTSISNVLTGIKTTLSTIWTAIVGVVMAILNPFIQGITNIFNSLKGGLTTVFNGLKTFFTGVWNAIKLIFLAPILLICDLVTGNFGKLKTDAAAIFNGLKVAFTQIWAGIKLVFTGVVTAIASFLTLEWNGIVNIAKGVWNGLKTFFVGLWDGINNVAIAAWNGLKTGIVNICNGIKTGAVNIFNGILNFFRGLPGTLSSLGSNMFNALKNGISSVLSTLGGVIKNGFNSGIAFIKSLPANMLSWGKNFIQGFIDGVGNMVGAVVDKVKGVANKISSTVRDILGIHSPSRVMVEIGQYTMQGLANGITNSTALVAKAIAKALNAITGTDIKAKLDTYFGRSLLSLDSDMERLAIDTGNLTENLENQKLSLLDAQDEVTILTAKWQQMGYQFGYSSQQCLDARKELETSITTVAKMGQQVEDTTAEVATANAKIVADAAETADAVTKLAEETATTNLNNLSSGLNSLFTNIKDALKENYANEQSMSEENINKQIANNIALKESSLSTIDTIYNAKVSALDAESTQYDIANQDAEDATSETELRRQLAMHLGAAERKTVQAQLDTLLKTNETRKYKESITAQKATLATQNVADKAAVETTAAANATLYATQLESIKTFYANKVTEASLDAEAQKMIVENNQNEITSLLQAYGKDYAVVGASLGERLVLAFKDQMYGLADVINGVLDNINSSVDMSAITGTSNAVPVSTTMSTNSFSSDIANTIKSALGSNSSNKSSQTIVVPVYLDGKTIATVTTPYSDSINGSNLALTGRGL